MTARQKFWLKVALAVTFPLWIAPVVVIGVAVFVGQIIWDVVSALVEPREKTWGDM